MIAVLFATIEEAEPFLKRSWAEPVACASMPVYRIPDSSGGPSTRLAAISGMGPDRASRAVRRLTGLLPLQAVVNTGICGALKDHTRFAAGSLFIVNRVFAAFGADAARPPAIPVATAPWRHLAPAALATVAHPLFDSEGRRRYAAIADLVDMEGAAVAQAAIACRIDCYLLKGVSDRADCGERDALQRNLDPVSRRLAAELVKGLARLDVSTDASENRIEALP